MSGLEVIGVVALVLVWSSVLMWALDYRTDMAARAQARQQNLTFEMALRAMTRTNTMLATTIAESIATSVDAILNPVHPDVEVEGSLAPGAPQQAPPQQEGEPDANYILRLAQLGYPAPRPAWADPLPADPTVFDDPIDLDKPLDAFEPFAHVEDQEPDIEMSPGVMVDRERAVVVAPGYDPVAEMGHGDATS